MSSAVFRQAPTFDPTEWKVWEACKSFDRDDGSQNLDEFFGELAEKYNLEVPQVRAIFTFGLYAGGRDEETGDRHGFGHALYVNGDEFVGEFRHSVKSGPGRYVYHSRANRVKKDVKRVFRALKSLRVARGGPTEGEREALVDELAESLQMTAAKRILFHLYDFGLKIMYVGQFAENKRSGQGWMFYPDGTLYEGGWREGRRHGTGTYYYLNGDVYSGSWREGQRHGRGWYYQAQSDSKFEGRWLKGQLNRGAWTTDVATVRGRFRNGVPTGSVVIEKFQNAPEVQVAGEYRQRTWCPADVGTVNLTDN